MSVQKGIKPETLPGFGDTGSFKDRVLAVLAKCWCGVFSVKCVDGLIKFYDPNGKLLDECPTGHVQIYDCGPVTPDADYEGTVKIFFNDIEGCVYYRQKDGSWYSPTKKV